MRFKQIWPLIFSYTEVIRSNGVRGDHRATDTCSDHTSPNRTYGPGHVFKIIFSFAVSAAILAVLESPASSLGLCTLRRLHLYGKGWFSPAESASRTRLTCLPFLHPRNEYRYRRGSWHSPSALCWSLSYPRAFMLLQADGHSSPPHRA
jgi:hypothetical protein